MRILEVNNLYNGAGAENVMKSIWQSFSCEWNKVFYVTTQHVDTPDHIQIHSIQQIIFSLLSKWKSKKGIAPKISNPIDSLGKKVSLRLKRFLPLSNFFINRKFEKIIKEIQPDIVHIHNLQPYGVGILEVFKKHNIPTFITLHWYWPICPSSLLYTAHWKKICEENNWNNCSKNCGTFDISNIMKKQKKLIEENVTQLITVSDFVRNRLIDFWYSPKKITTIHNGVDVDLFHPVDNPTRDYILHVGRLSEIKGSLLVLDAAKKLPNIKFIFIGSARPDIEIPENVKFIEWISSNELVKYYQNAIAVVAPSLWPEPHSLVPLEVMACGTPIIATNVGGNSESIINEKVWILANDTDEVVQAIQDLTLNSTLPEKRISHASRVHIENKFSIKQMFSWYKKLFFNQN